MYHCSKCDLDFTCDQDYKEHLLMHELEYGSIVNKQIVHMLDALIFQITLGHIYRLQRVHGLTLEEAGELHWNNGKRVAKAANAWNQRQRDGIE